MKTYSILGLFCFLLSGAFAPVTLAQSNSTVRFVISYGTFTDGSFDVELYDTAKPITVSNFLVYAQSGAYSNTIMDYCVPSSFVQGGFGTVKNPLSTDAFTRFYAIPARASIPNEFSVGPRLDNTNGTLAMALEVNPNDRNATLPNSATSSWFFNLANNSPSLDPRLHTVFGRVTSGLNILQHFNALTASNRVINLTNPACGQLRLFPGEFYLPLLKLPVGAFLPVSGCPRYADLYRVEIQMLNARDVVGPILTVSNPVANLVITNGTVTVSGSAYDNVAVSNVVVEILGYTNLLVSSTNGAFSATLTNIPPGTNVIVVTASDYSTNLTQISRRIFHRVKVPISLTIDGSGTISGATNTMPLEVGRAYTVVAKPVKGHLFAAWSEGPNSSVITNPFSPTLKFIMETNLALTATFGTNLFPAVQGVYSGLFYNPTAVEQHSSGFLTFKVGRSGATSGKLLLNGKSISVKGSLNAFGVGEFTTLRKGTNPIVLEDLALDLTDGTDRLTGLVTEQASTGAVWSVPFTADRAYYNGRDLIAPETGKYTMLFPADPASTNGLNGDGFGAVTVGKNGGVSFAGTLADGTKVSQKTALSKYGQWPFYLPLYKGKGSLLSLVTFTNETATDFTDLFYWFKQAQVTKYFASGFTNQAILIGSQYVFTPSNAVINLTNATIAFTNGSLAADFTNHFDIDPKGKAFPFGTNKLKLAVNRSSGLFSGSVVPDGTNRAMKFQGAVFQKQTNAAGFFLGATNRSGRVFIEPR